MTAEAFETGVMRFEVLPVERRRAGIHRPPEIEQFYPLITSDLSCIARPRSFVVPESAPVVIEAEYSGLQGLRFCESPPRCEAERELEWWERWLNVLLLRTRHAIRLQRRCDRERGHAGDHESFHLNIWRNQ